MQLFVTNPCPQMSAIALDDKRLIKAVLETAQIISTVTGKGYRPTHENHPITLWAKRNIHWVCSHYVALASEYSHRFGRTHASVRVIGGTAYKLATSAETFGYLNFAKNSKRRLDFTWVRDVHQAYRMYLRARWVNDLRPPKWTNRKKPKWIPLGEGPGSDGQLLAIRARAAIGFAQTGTSGELDCPACGDRVEWKCEGAANYVELKCVMQDCIYWKEELRK